MSDQIPPAHRASRNSDLPVTIIRPSAGWKFPDLKELLAHHELMSFLVQRNIKVRYRQTVLGWAWAIIQPLATMAIMTFVFGRIIGIATYQTPYWLFALTGVVLWMFINQSVSATATSLINNSQLIEKVYLPRLAIPTATIVASLVDLAISMVMLLLAILISGLGLSPRMLLMPLIVLTTALMCTGLGSALAAISVRYRDVVYLVPFGLQLWFFATPIAYPLSLVPENWRPLMAANPATGLCEIFRWAMLGTNSDFWQYVPISMMSLAVVLFCGLLVFRRMERSFADVI